MKSRRKPKGFVDMSMILVFVFLIGTAFITLAAIVIVVIKLGGTAHRSFVIGVHDAEGLALAEGIALFHDTDRAVIEQALHAALAQSPDQARIDRERLRLMLSAAMKVRGTPLYSLTAASTKNAFSIYSQPRPCKGTPQNVIAYCESGPRCSPGRTTFSAGICGSSELCCKEEYDFSERRFTADPAKFIDPVSGRQHLFTCSDGTTQGACEILSCAPGRFGILKANVSQCSSILNIYSGSTQTKILPLSHASKPFVCCSPIRPADLRTEVVAEASRFSIPTYAPGAPGSLSISVEQTG